ncbi:MAG: caspase family protein [Rhodocyclales bacterium]|nr:caspase family protein [Rhodocyclales bacterium]
MRQAYNRKGRVSYLRIVATAATLLVAPAFHAMAAAEQKVALVIGNSAYPSSRLRNPVNDAKAMADKLRALGFEVILRTDSNLREMTRSFSQFGQKLTPGSVSLFYYAGHGVQVRGKNYLIPVDAEIENEASVTSEAVDVDQLLNQLGPARLSMVILDACRNNPFERRFRAAGSGGLAQIDAPTGTLLAYATAPGKVAADGHGSNGVYTEALLKALDMPGLKVEDVFKQVRINVVRASDGQQTPWESSSLTGEFYFHAASKAEIDSAQLRRAENERAELARTLEEERRKRDKDAELVRPHRIRQQPRPSTRRKLRSQRRQCRGARFPQHRIRRTPPPQRWRPNGHLASHFWRKPLVNSHFPKQSRFCSI